MTQEPERIQKIIAEAGLCSRRNAERLIRAGRVKLNGETVLNLGTKALLGEDEIIVDGKRLGGKESLFYYMFHKPSGVITALKSDRLKRPTIAPFLKELPARVYPVGRLDRDVSGFLVLTNDGELARRLMHPSYMVPKVYRAFVEGGTLTKEDLFLISSGTLEIDGKPVAKATARNIESGEDKGMVELVLTEGRKRQVKRMFGALGHPVLKLKRIAYCGVELDKGLAPGSLRELKESEIKLLKDKVGL
jgi:23S rRNA pseudouridine2605 synthase